MPYRTRSARLAASLLSAVVAVLAFAVPSSSRAATAIGAAAQHWVTPAAAAQLSGTHTANSPGQQRPRAHGAHVSYGAEGPAGTRAVHAAVAHLHQGHLPHPPFPGTTGPGTERAPHRSLGGPDARLFTSTPPAQFAHAAAEPRGPPSRRS
ncbi:hypothetical protein ABT390_22000 [Streptomyces aurantiacus]|uniref:Uncharacterized protein n=1 Tax=Streptomyces aurantiacus JA 4570 TaxID=1286094 RepID=S3ZPM3_9ACTN|nr:hypothetical protein [Streptomyces aurantiacus]EPH45123.1 hypothetical protein STRAU_1751 [Streptomyces aurantiacus JA 4570]